MGLLDKLGLRMTPNRDGSFSVNFGTKADGVQRSLNMREKSISREMLAGSEYAEDEDSIQYSDYALMMEDPQVKAAVKLKILARLSTGFDIVPASEDAQDVEVAEFVTDQFTQMAGTVGVFMRRAMMATVYKMSVHEIVFRPLDEGKWSGKVGLQALKYKRYDPDVWRVKSDEFGNMEKVEQNVRNEWRQFDPFYFAVWCNDHEGDWIGKSDLKSAYRYWKAKSHIDKMWNIFVERMGSPTPIGKHPPNAQHDERMAVLEFLQKMTTRKSAVVPSDWELELIEASGEGETFEKRMQYCDRMIARSVLLPTLMLDEGSSGSYSLGRQHSETFRWVIEDMGETFSEDVMHEQVIKRLVEINYDVEDYPRLVWRPIEREGFNEYAEAFAKLVDKGIVGADEDIVRERLDLPSREEGAEPSTEPETSPSAPASPATTQAKTKVKDEGDGDTGAPGATPQEAKHAAFEMLTHAEKCDFEAMGSTMDSLEQEQVLWIADIMERMRDDLLQTVRRKGLSNPGTSPAAIDRLRLSYVGELRDSLFHGFGNSCHLGTAFASQELEAGLSAVGAEDRPDVVKPIKDLNYVVAADLKTKQRYDSMDDIISFWKGKVPIQKALLEEYARQSFTIAGVTNNDLLGKAQTTIRRGLMRGATSKQIEFELSKLFLPYIGHGVDAAVLAPNRLHTIARTNIAEAFNSGRMNLFRHPEVRTFIRGYEYSAVMDDRTTEFCKEWHGKVMVEDDPLIGQIQPPNHYQCRSILIPVVKGEPFKPDTELPGQQPADGFAI